jgi:hypothetical protein
MDTDCKAKLTEILAGVDDKGISWADRLEAAISRGIQPEVFCVKLIANFSGQSGLQKWYEAKASYFIRDLERINENKITVKDQAQSFFDKWGHGESYLDRLKTKHKLPHGLELQVAAKPKQESKTTYEAHGTWQGRKLVLEYKVTL